MNLHRQLNTVQQRNKSKNVAYNKVGSELGSSKANLVDDPFLCLEKVSATDSSDLPAAHTYPASTNTFIKKALGKLKRRAETEDVKMWVTHLDSATR